MVWWCVDGGTRDRQRHTKIHWYTSHIFGIRQIWVWIPALFLSNHVTLVVLTFEPQCPHLQNGDNKVSTKLLWDKMIECTYTYLCTELSDWCSQMVATNSRQFFKGQMLQVKHIGFLSLSFFLSKGYVYVINWMTARSGFLSHLEEGKRKRSQLKLCGSGGCAWISNSPGKMCGLVHQRVPEPGRQQMPTAACPLPLAHKAHEEANQPAQKRKI